MRVRRCPCCAGEDLWVGVMSASSYGVACGCGLTMIKRIPDDWPKGVFKKSLSGEENLKRLHRWAVGEAVEKWNKRVPGSWADGYVDIEPNIEP